MIQVWLPIATSVSSPWIVSMSVSSAASSWVTAVGTIWTPTKTGTSIELLGGFVLDVERRMTDDWMGSGLSGRVMHSRA